MRVEIYSDIVCPWCYIGEERFFRALSSFPQSDQIEVVFRPYQLDPGLPEDPEPLMDRLEKKFGAQLDAVLRQASSAAAQEGLELRFDKAYSVNTLTAHRLLHLALAKGGPATQRAVAKRLFEAHFTQGENVASVELLSDLAASEGLDREQVHAYLASDEGIEEVRAAVEASRRRGIRAVPTFVFDDAVAVQGAQSTSTFLQVLDELQSDLTQNAGTAFS